MRPHQPSTTPLSERKHHAPRTASTGTPVLNDISVGGDPLAVEHLAPPRPGPPATVAEFTGLVRAVAADRARWGTLTEYDPVTRWYHRLEQGPGYEVWLLSWLPGQSTGRHDHGRSHGVFTVLQGTLTERSLTRSGAVARRLRPGVERVLAPGCVHEVGNDTLEPAVSVHVYFPGLTEMTPHPCPPRVRGAATSETP